MTSEMVHNLVPDSELKSEPTLTQLFDTNRQNPAVTRFKYSSRCGGRVVSTVFVTEIRKWPRKCDNPKRGQYVVFLWMFAEIQGNWV